MNKLAAASLLYSRAKKIFWLRTIIALGFSVLVPFFLSDNQHTKSILNFSSFVFLFINALWLETIELNYRRHAAGIQELFDSDVLGINPNLPLLEEEPEKCDIENYAQLFKGNMTRIKDWYPRKLNKESRENYCARCQKTNVDWDLRLRVKVFGWLLFISITSVFVIFCLYYFENRSLKQLFENFLIPISPLCFILIQYLKNQIASIRRLRVLGKRFGELNFFSLPKKKRMTREIQDAIFIHRSNATYVPDWIYKINRKNFQKMFGIFDNKKN